MEEIQNIVEEKQEKEVDINVKSIGGFRALFMRGHSGYLLLFIWGLSNILIVYSLGGNEIPLIQELFPNVMAFAGAFVVSYVSLCVILGYIDIKIKKIFGQETGLLWDTIPQVQEILSILRKLAELVPRLLSMIEKLNDRVAELERKLEEKE